MMEPLRVTARLANGIINPRILLDTLLASAVAQSEGYEPARHDAPVQRSIAVPLARDPSDRVYLASSSVSETECRELEYTNRRFPVAEAQMLGHPSLTRVMIAAGPCKSYRIPRVREHLTDDTIRWFCVGDAPEIRYLLGWVGYLGRRRAVGAGRVAEWRVERFPAWGPGFPLVWPDGQPTRALPVGWPGVADDADQAIEVCPDPLRGRPSWARHFAEPCVVPR